MTPTNQLKATGDVPVSSTGSPHAPSGVKKTFAGPKGLRAGWRLLVFAVLVVLLLGAFLLIRNGGVQGFQEARKHAGQVVVTPLLMGGSEAMAFVLLCLATLIMGKMEHRSFSDYGLPLRPAFGKEFWMGCMSGFLAITGTLFTMYLLRGFRITGVALQGTAILSAMIAWGAAFILVGLFEEFLCRGYMQYTLASGIGFWPAAFVVSGLFGLIHLFNSGENVTGAVAAGMHGLLFCLFLRRTGSIWCSVGFHAAWDWGQTFYGVPDSGMLPYHSVFHSAFSGPVWLTGGVVGPEGSFIMPIALLIVALIFSRYYPENRYQVPRSATMTAA